MKKLFLLSGAAVLFACSQPKPIDYTILSGSIKNADSDSVFVFGEDFKLAAKIAEDGSFLDTIRIENGYYDLVIGRESSPMFLQKGTALQLSIDVKEFDESLQYSGSGAAENNILAHTMIYTEQAEKSVAELFSLPEDSFLLCIGGIRDSLHAMISHSKAIESFKNDQMDDADYRFAGNMMRYPKYHRHFAKNPEYTPSDAFAAAKPEIDLGSEANFKRSDLYRDLVNTDFSDKIDALSDSMTTYDEAIQKAAENLEKGHIKNEILNSYANFMISPNENLESNYNFFITEVSDTAYLAKYETLYEKMKKLSKGMPSPSFTRYENHAGDSTSFEELAGKYTYFDVWATWCGPCIREIPSLQEVEKNYHGKNIQFVSVSIDRMKDHDTWVNMVNDKELGGMQLMADKAWQSDFVRDYEINGIPRFILVDPEGNIVSADAPRPSNPGLIELFDELGI